MFSFLFAATVAQAVEPQISFAEAYRSILDRNLRIETQQLNIDISERRKQQALGTFLPTVSAEFRDTEGTVQFESPRSLGVQATLNVFRSGADHAGYRAAEKDLESQKRTLEREKQNAEDDAAVAIFQYIAQSRLAEIGAKLSKLKEDAVRVARERFNRGLMPLQEVDKTSIDLDITRARLADTIASQADAGSKLQTLLGHVNVSLDWPWIDQMTEGDADIERRELEILKRPDYLASVAAIEAKQFKRSQAFANLLPSVDIIANYGAGNYTADWTPQLVGILKLTVPIFDGFKAWGEYKVENARAMQAEITAEGIRRLAPAEVVSLKKSYKLARESALAREATAKTTLRLYNDNQQRFRLGRASANDLALDQARLLESQQLAVQGWSNAHLSFMRLCHGLGASIDANGHCRDN